jgi:hypothetical protein
MCMCGMVVGFAQAPRHAGRPGGLCSNGQEPRQEQVLSIGAWREILGNALVTGNKGPAGKPATALGSLDFLRCVAAVASSSSLPLLRSQPLALLFASLLVVRYGSCGCACHVVAWGLAGCCVCACVGGFFKRILCNLFRVCFCCSLSSPTSRNEARTVVLLLP